MTIEIPLEYEGSTSLGFYIRLYNNYWYTYEEANDFCVQQGTRLAVVDTTDKINIIIALPGFDITYYYLVAATDNVKEGSFVWSTGSPVSRDAQLWHDYQPNNAGGNQNCLTLKQSKASLHDTDHVRFVSIVIFPGHVESEFLEWIWDGDVDFSKKNFSSLTLTTTALSEVNCLVICTQWVTNVAATFNSDTSTCSCYAELNGLPSNPGDRLWKTIPSGYDGSMSLGFYARLYHYYWYNYDEANDFCVQQGTRLAVLDTTEKIKIIVIALPGYSSTHHYLVAATDNVQEDSFVWSTGSPVSRDAQLWHDYQPNNDGGNQNCLTLTQSKFDDVTCTDDFKFICELI
ncbi:uncharacterized protein LOC117340590 [Pecten maximus]|uniref:uncharacterized protein LOC117340590 n=1 Tax=Pecten maximus TaxID=6579 RepID=UPI001459023A|nr:uncharacterized protein LOC117340590 [Pecten maximus]